VTDADDPLNSVIAEYLQAVDAGQTPDREALIARHPHLADRLRAYFADQDRLDALAGSVRAPAAATLTLPPAVAAPLGTVRYFGDYELLAEVARGGMGVVFKARQVSLNRVVALKMILAGRLASPADVVRFRREAEAAANLDHPHILPIYEVGEHGGQHYFSMKLVEGGSLAGTGEEFRRRPRAAVESLVKVCRAVHYAHQRRILHRDLKPANVLLDRDGTPYVTDFGLAKPVEGDSGLTQSGAILGTPSYMAPEQARADKALSTAVDVYALGAILYELLTGRPPFKAATPLDTVLQVIDREPARPRSLNPAADRDLETVALKCLEKDPAKRYDSAAAVADDLERWLRGEPILARSSNSWERAMKWAKRHPAVAGLTAALILTMVVGAAVSTALYLRAEEERAVAVRERNDATEQRRAVQEQLWRTTFERARAERLAGHRRRSLEVLAEAARMRAAPELRQEAIQSLILPEVRPVCRLGPRSLHIGGGDVHVIEFSADSSLLAHVNNYRKTDSPISDYETGIEVWAIPSGKLVARTRAEYGGDGRTFAFSPTAPVLAVCGEGKVRVWEPAAGRDVTSFAGRPPVCFSPDGRGLAATGPEGVLVAEVDTGKARPLAAKGQPRAFLSANDLLLEHDGRLIRWDLAADREAFATPAGLRPATISSDGRLAVLRSRNAPGTVWDLAAGRELGEARGLERVSYRASAPLNGTAGLLAFADPADRLTIRLWDVRSVRARPGLRSPRVEGVALEYGSFRPDGSLLAALEYDGKTYGPNNTISVWDMNTARLLCTLRDADRPVWSPDGRYLATIGEGRFTTPDGEATVSGDSAATRVYEVTTPAPAARAAAAVEALTFDPDGRHLVTNEAVWTIASGTDRRTLLPVALPPAAGSRSADHGRAWVVRDNARATADQPLTIRQLFPEALEIELRPPTESATVQRPPDQPPISAPADKVKRRVTGFAVSADGRRLLLGLELEVPIPDSTARSLTSRLELWDLAGRTRTAVLGPGEHGTWRAQRFSADGRTATAAGSRGVQLWDTMTGKPLPELQEAEVQPSQTYLRRVRRAAFAPDGRRVFGALDHHALAVFEIATGRLVRSWPGPTAEVTALAVAPDGRTAASGDDRTVCLWDVETGRELARWEGHEAPVTAVAFDPTGRALASGDALGTVKLWDLAYLRRELSQMALDW
jgi:eukaryotic-like serine/threonine-protein kinase